MVCLMSDEMMSERIQFLMTPSLRRAIKAWRHRNEIDSEGEAIRQLLKDAIEMHEEPRPPERSGPPSGRRPHRSG